MARSWCVLKEKHLLFLYRLTRLVQAVNFMGIGCNWLRKTSWRQHVAAGGEACQRWFGRTTGSADLLLPHLATAFGQIDAPLSYISFLCLLALWTICTWSYGWYFFLRWCYRTSVAGIDSTATGWNWIRFFSGDGKTYILMTLNQERKMGYAITRAEF